MINNDPPLNELLLRKVKFAHIRPDKTILNEAFRPRKTDDSTTGLENNISTAPKSCYNTEDKLKTFLWERTAIYEIHSQYPDSISYLQCIETNYCHVGICGDMRLLNNDDETREFLAQNSLRHYP
jgi:hypothetical protein